MPFYISGGDFWTINHAAPLNLFFFFFVVEFEFITWQKTYSQLSVEKWNRVEVSGGKNIFTVIFVIMSNEHAAELYIKYKSSKMSCNVKICTGKTPVVRCPLGVLQSFGKSNSTTWTTQAQYEENVPRPAKEASSWFNFVPNFVPWRSGGYYATDELRLLQNWPFLNYYS